MLAAVQGSTLPCTNVDYALQKTRAAPTHA
ncbi:hypothetical protein MY1884_008733, partial [Beauveria asiatica]